MANLNFLLGVADVAKHFHAPKGMWESLISGIHSWGIGYAWTIVLLTIFIKIAMTPMDFWQKLTQKMSMLKQEAMKPEQDAINKRYKYDNQMRNQKTMELQKKHKVSPMGSCFAVLINLAVVLTVFLTLISGMNKMSFYNMEQTYGALAKVYIEAEGKANTLIDGQIATIKSSVNEAEVKAAARAAEETKIEAEVRAANPNADQGDLEGPTGLIQVAIDAAEAEIQAAENLAVLNAQEAAVKQAREAEIKKATDKALLAAWKKGAPVRERFIWIDNIWRKDTSERVIPLYEQVDSGKYVKNKKDYFVKERKAAGGIITTTVEKNGKKETATVSISTEKVYTGPKLKLDKNKNLVIVSDFYKYVDSKDYNTVMDSLMTKTKGDWNGYYILTILAVLTTFLSTFIMSKKGFNANPGAASPTGSAQAGKNAGKTMMFIMPVVMGVFTLTASSTFAIYIVISQILAILSTLALTPLINKIVAKKKNKEEDPTKPKVNYSR